MLRRLGAPLQRCSAIAASRTRYGGEESALILPHADQPTASAACERLRAAAEAEPWSAVHPELQITVSIGAVHAQEAEGGGESAGLLAAPDSRLYAAKRGGRNRVVGAGG